MIVDKTEIKDYLKITDDEEDEIVESLQVAAEEYLTNAGVKKDYDKKLYVLAIKLLIAHWYDNRMIQSDKAHAKLSFSLDAIILQLIYSSDTSV